MEKPNNTFKESKGLQFTAAEEAEFQEMIKFKPKGFGQWMGVKADRVANTVQMFFTLLVFSLVSYVWLRPILDQMLFISNTYQLIALPILGIATGLSMLIILRFLFRILLEIRKEFREIKQMHRTQTQEIIELRQVGGIIVNIQGDINTILKKLNNQNK